MRNPLEINRRAFLAASAAAIASPSAPAAYAQQDRVQAAAADFWAELGRLAAEARRLGVAVPRMSVGVDPLATADFMQIMPATVDLIDSATASSARAVGPAPAVDDLLAKAHDLLARINQLERNLPTERDIGVRALAVPGNPTFESLRADYARLFESCRVRDSHRALVQWYVSKLEDGSYRKRWYEAAKETCCPWYFVGIVHALEASFNFQAHLHNGDPLTRRTVQVPAGRPPQWRPPNDWISSAVDAIRYEDFADQGDWTLERTLFRWEAYNGFRSRRNGINTPYLWSFSNHYSKGKFVADNVWDPNAVSKQCGAAVMLKALIDRGSATLPS